MLTVYIIKYGVHKTKCRPHSVFRSFFDSDNKQLHFLMQNYAVSFCVGKITVFSLRYGTNT